MLTKLVYLLSYLNTATLLLPLGVGLARRSRLTPALWWGWVALLLYFLLFVGSMGIVYGGVPLPTQSIPYLISATFGSAFSVAFCLMVPPGRRRWVMGGLGVIGLVGILTEAIWQGHYNQTSQWSVPLRTVITTLTTLLYLHVLLRQTRISLLRVPFFWLTIALLVSSVLGTFYDAFQHLMMAASVNLVLGWLCFQLSVTIGCNVVYAVGFYRVGAA